MKTPSQSNRFPQVIESALLGPLVYEESMVSGNVCRNCEVERTFQVGPHDNVELIILPPESGMVNTAALVAFLEARWAKITADYDRLVATFVPVIGEAITEFCIPDEQYTPPTAHELLAEAKLEWIALNLDGVHQFHFACGESVGGHDLIVSLSPNLDPLYAGFDG